MKVLRIIATNKSLLKWREIFYNRVVLPKDFIFLFNSPNIKLDTLRNSLSGILPFEFTLKELDILILIY